MIGAVPRAKLGLSNNQIPDNKRSRNAIWASERAKEAHKGDLDAEEEEEKLKKLFFSIMYVVRLSLSLESPYWKERYALERYLLSVELISPWEAFREKGGNPEEAD